jgi:cellulose synthase/poly-beta-1,6-N-acetylglucosamine synthase-like glycosyltransferase
MQNELAKLMAVAFTIIAIVSESAMIISGLMYDMSERVIVGAFGMVVVVPLIVSMWADLRRQNA